MGSVEIKLRLVDSLRQKLELPPYGTANANAQINKSLDRYLLIMAEEKQNIKEYFTEQELEILSAICEKERFIPAESCEDRLFELVEKSGVPELKAKLKELDLIALFALIEIIGK